MSNVKVRLKNAREAIDKKDYEKALSECSIALNFEPENYHAMVFLAVAQQNLEQSDKAKETLYKAIALNPTSPIAHQVKEKI
jgi:superkiller protein 3